MSVFISFCVCHVTLRQKFSQTFRQHDHTKLFTFAFSCQHRFYDAVNDPIDVHDLASRSVSVCVGRLFGFFVLVVDIFDADDQTRLSGNCGSVRKPARTTSHRLAEKV